MICCESIYRKNYGEEFKIGDGNPAFTVSLKLEIEGDLYEALDHFLGQMGKFSTDRNALSKLIFTGCGWGFCVGMIEHVRRLSIMGLLPCIRYFLRRESITVYLWFGGIKKPMYHSLSLEKRK